MLIRREILRCALGDKMDGDFFRGLFSRAVARLEHTASATDFLIGARENRFE